MMLALLLSGCENGEVKSTIPGSLPIEKSSNDDFPPEISRSSYEEPPCTEEDSCSDDSDIIDVPELKPIIYFYPEEEMDLTVKARKANLLTTTYPKYDNGWNIHLKEDGTFTVPGSDREYYALYFEAESHYVCAFDEGFYVTKEKAASFLEEKMDLMGFTNRETDEFIMYWLPVLEANEQSLVYFEQTEERNEDFPLSFSTQPTTLIRTMIHVKKVAGQVDIAPEELTHYERSGFTDSEWGGVKHR